MTDYQHEPPHDDAPFFAGADLGDAPPTAASVPLFQPVATAPAKTADEALAALAAEVIDLAAREETAFDRLADVPRDEPEYATLSAEAGELEKGVLGRLTMAALVWADTPDGLAAKGRAVLAYRKTLEGCVVNEAQPLLLSMAEDAVRLAARAPTAEADAAVIALAKRVGRLARMELRAFNRLADVERAIEARLGFQPQGEEAKEAAEAARKAEMAKIGNVLDYRMNDPVFTEAVERARAAAERARAPFVAALAAWKAEQARLFREMGAEAAVQRQSRLTDRLEAVGLRLAAMKPRTLAACIAMAEAADAVSSIGISGGWGETLHEAVTRALAQLRTKKPATLHAVRPSAPDRLAMESYRTWLEMEHCSLTHEMYPGQPEALGSVYLNNPGGRFHFRGGSPASSRAERMLAAVGVDWRHDPVAEIDRQHERAA